MRLRIDVDYLAEQLQRLLAIASPSGYTDNIVRYCTEELQRMGLKPELTRRGAIRAIRPGAQRAPARAIVSHLDTLGAQVKRVKENGRLELVPIGHWSSRFAEGARITLFSEKGSYRGTILPLKASGHTYNKEVDTQPVGWEYVSCASMRTPAPCVIRRRWESTWAISSPSIPSRSSSATASSSPPPRQQSRRGFDAGGTSGSAA
jgi:hypothetical protein